MKKVSFDRVIKNESDQETARSVVEYLHAGNLRSDGSFIQFYHVVIVPVDPEKKLMAI